MDAHLFKHILIQNTLTMKEFGLLPILHQSTDIPPVNSTPCFSVCVCVRGKQWIDREGVTHYSMGASILWHSTINKTPLVFDPLMWAGYPLPTDREAEGVKEQVQTIAISQEWCENVSLTTWTWISPRAGVQFCDHGNYYKLLHQSLQHPTERRRTPMSVTHSHVKWHRHAPERYADTDNMT